MSDDEESYTHTFYRQHLANGNELLLPEQQDQQLVLLVPTWCPRYATVSDQWSWWRLVILPMMVVGMAIPLVVNCGALFTSILRCFGVSTIMAHTLLVVVYGGTALWAIYRGVIHACRNEGWWMRMSLGSPQPPIYSTVTNPPDSMNEDDSKKKSAAECSDDHIAVMENVV
jgi:hypothetical protein